MKIGGLQKLTLLDFPGKTACTVFTVGCNFRCPFCHNALLVNDDDLTYISEDDFFKFLSTRKGLLDGVCVTGGEPLLQGDIENFISHIKTMGFLVKLDTNGSIPDKLQQLLDENLLDYVAVDLKNSKSRYCDTIGVKNFDYSKIENTIDILRTSNVEYEFRTTVCAPLHSADDITELSSKLQPHEKYFIQKFKDSGSLLDNSCYELDENEIKQMCDNAKKYVKNVGLRG